MSSKAYWEKREAEALKHYLQEEQEYQAQLRAIYQNMLDAAQKEIDAFYGRYADKEQITLAEAKRRVSKLDIAAYARPNAMWQTRTFPSRPTRKCGCTT